MAIKPFGFPYFQELCALRPELCGFPYYQTLDPIPVTIVTADGASEGEITGNKYWIQDGDKCDEKQQ